MGENPASVGLNGRSRRDRYAAVFEIPIDRRLLRFPEHHHLDNVAVALCYDIARLRFCEALNGLTEPLIAQITLNYLAEAPVAPSLAVGCIIAKIGRSSFTMAQGLFEADRFLGACEAVFVNADDAGPRALSAGARKRLESMTTPTGP